MSDQITITVIRFARIPIAALSILSNLPILNAIFRYRTMRNNTSNMLIAQLAFADLFIGKENSLLNTLKGIQHGIGFDT